MPPGPSLRFDRAQYGGDGAPVPGLCAFCGRGLDETQFEVLGRPACDVCGRRALSYMPTEGPSTYVRSLGVGTVAALAAGLILAAILFALPPFNGRLWLAYFASLGIGWVIGKAMQIAAQGAGGRRYQVAAAVLTYIAVILPLQFDLMGAREAAWWVYPLVLLRPFAFLFAGLASLGLWQLLAAFLGIRFAWILLKAPPTFIRQVKP